MNEPIYMVFDVESIGIHGEGYSYGFVVVDGDGREIAEGGGACPPAAAAGVEAGRRWVAENAPEHQYGTVYPDPESVRQSFWSAWQDWQAQGAVLAANCPWPVEARFLIQSVGDDPLAREWGGPYPLIDVASVRLAAGLDPLGTDDRLPGELPVHDPVADARQSARFLTEALAGVRRVHGGGD